MKLFKIFILHLAFMAGMCANITHAQTKTSIISTIDTKVVNNPTTPLRAYDLNVILKSILNYNSDTLIRVNDSTIKVKRGSDSFNVVIPALPYKVYTAILNQTSTSAPVATVLSNTITGSIVWSRIAVGKYRGTLTGAFPLNKTVVIGQKNCSDYNFDESPESLRVGWNISANYITLTTGDGNGNDYDGALINALIEIRVYP